MKREFTFRSLALALAAPLLLATAGVVQAGDTIDADPVIRRQAVEEILRTLDDAAVAALRAQLSQETDAGVRGMGKTTLLRALLGLVPAASGAIVYDGHELRGLPAEVRARLRIGYVPQGREIFSQLSVEENLRIGLGARATPGRAADVFERVYAIFPALRQMGRRRGGELSGGQQQLAIGRALVLDPQLLILDEPCEGIQPNIVAEIGELLLRLNRELGLTLLLVEQKLPFARRVASEFRSLDKGRLVAGGPIAELGDDIVHRHLTV
ncbi:ATP-binding cassette domain-containing protein [Solimonas flava]|uniref:ATP-binding cassette domain-containing protein n=1 Tax=Solimonas flava TaxID=415849 RepID=UPI00041F43FE|nr:ATP-binding cassette domain-containing protein [Solimonas flava]